MPCTLPALQPLTFPTYGPESEYSSASTSTLLRVPTALAPPAHPDGAAWALFLDFDGTLIEFAATPDAVVVPPGLARGPRRVHRCVRRGGRNRERPVDRRRSTPCSIRLRMTAAGLHGLELRLPDGSVEQAGHRDPRARRAPRAVSLRSFEKDARLVVEDKGSSVALHFRRAPERERELRELVAGAATPHDGYQVMHGKKVLEIRPTGVDKGTAIDRLLGAPPFAGRRPVFAGDDITDEDGFAAVNGLRRHQHQGGSGGDPSRIPGTGCHGAARLAGRRRRLNELKEKGSLTGGTFSLGRPIRHVEQTDRTISPAPDESVQADTRAFSGQIDFTHE